jgi:hypothetical protein
MMALESVDKELKSAANAAGRHAYRNHNRWRIDLNFVVAYKITTSTISCYNSYYSHFIFIL